MKITNPKIEALIKKFINNQRENALTNMQTYKPRLQILESFVSGKAWEEGYIENGDKNEWNENPITNIAHLIWNIKSSSIQYNDIKVKLLPLASNEVDTVEELDQVLNTIWKRIGIDKHIKDTASDAFKFPIGISKIAYNDNKLITIGDRVVKGEVVLETVNPANFFWDPRAYNIEKCEFVFELRSVSFYEIENQPLFDLSEFLEQKLLTYKNSDKFNDANNGDVDVYVDIYNENFRNWLYMQQFSLYEVYYKYDVNTINPKVLQFYMIDDSVVFYVEDIKTKILPYSIFKQFNVSHSFYGTNSIETTLDNQKLLNKVNAIKYNILTQMQSPTTVISKKSGIDASIYASINGAPGIVAVVNGDPQQAIYKIPPVPITQDVLASSNDIIENIKLVAGISSFETGEAPGSVSTTGAMNLIAQQNANNQNNTKIEFTYYIKRLYQLFANIISANSQGKEFRVDTEDANSPYQFEFIKFNPLWNSVKTDMVIKVHMTQQEAQLEKQNIMELLQLQTQTGVEYVSPRDAIGILVDNEDNKETLLAAFEKRMQEQLLQDKQNKLSQQKTMIALQAALNFFEEQITKSEQEGGPNPNIPLQQLEQEAMVQGMQAAQQYEEQQQAQDQQTGVATGGGTPQENTGIAPNNPNGINK